MIWGAPPVTNDAGMAELAADCARDVVGDDMVMDHLDARTWEVRISLIILRSAGSIYVLKLIQSAEAYGCTTS